MFQPCTTDFSVFEKLSASQIFFCVAVCLVFQIMLPNWYFSSQKPNDTDTITALKAEIAKLEERLWRTRCELRAANNEIFEKNTDIRLLQKEIDVLVASATSDLDSHLG